MRAHHLDLDDDVLLAVRERDHGRAHEWLDREIDAGWASCAITQNGFVRIISPPRYPSPIAPAQGAALLARACTGGPHEFCRRAPQRQTLTRSSTATGDDRGRREHRGCPEQAPGRTSCWCAEARPREARLLRGSRLAADGDTPRNIEHDAGDEDARDHTGRAPPRAEANRGFLSGLSWLLCGGGVIATDKGFASREFEQIIACHDAASPRPR